MKRKQILKLLVAFALLGCSNSDDGKKEQIYLGEILFDFSLQDPSGTDLLDPNVEGSFNTDEIALYEKVDGTYILFDQPLSAHPKGYTIDEWEGLYYFTPYYFDAKAASHDLKIEWGNGKTDFILVTCEDGDGNWKNANEITYNGNLVWNMELNPEDKIFTIVVE